ncbi:MAG TPA: 50S ribosomal protein L25 [Solirubrobacteraceae bacterium]|nr:50S ribosomal protein L25 [Solirubrobacteraceae bacterium]
MATREATALTVEAREPEGSRAARRLRRTGKVPGVVYGGGEDPFAFAVDARVLRQALAHAGAVIELSVGGSGGGPVVLKDLVRHPVTGATVHIDLLRVRLDQTISSSVTIELVGADDAPGVKEGGVLEQVTREVTIEALPTDIPDSIEYEVSTAQIGDTVTLEALNMPPGVTLLEDPETVLMTLTPPRLQLEEEPEIEEETELVGEGETTEEAEARAEQDAEERGEGEGESGGE